MKKERGFIATIYLYVIAALGTTAALWWLQHSVNKAGYDRGTREVTAQYAARDNAALIKVNAALKAAEDQARALERKSAEDVAAVSAKYQSERENDAKRARKIIADLHTGALILRDPGATGSAGSAAGVAAAPGATAGGCDGGPPGRLSRSTSEFLVQLAGDADQVVRQLTAAQALIIKDREICR